MKNVSKTINGLSFPVPNYVLPFKTLSGVATQVVLDTDGKLPVSGSFTVDTSALATSAKQSDGSQKTQIVDAGGEAATVTGGKLDVNATAELAGEAIPISGATEAVAVGIVDGSGNQITSFGGGTQYTEGDTDASITGTALLWEDGSDTLRPVSAAKPLPISDAGGNISIDDGGNTITVDGTVAVTNAGLTELAAAIDTEVQVDVVGALPAGTNNIGDVDVLSSALPTGAATSAKQDTIIGHLDEVETSLSTIAGDTTDIEAAVELIDDTVATLGTDTYTEASSKGLVVGAVRRDADTTLVNTTNEVAPLQVDANGRLKVEAFSGETLPVSLTSTTVTGTVAVTQSGTWDEVGINDSGNSITVDATNLDIRDIDAASDDITIHGDVGVIDQLDLANSNPAAVAIVDGDGTQITSFGGGTQYTEGATDASITGTALLFEGAADTLVSAPGTAANGLDVDVTRVSGTVTVDGSGVTQPVSNAGLTELAAAINSSKVDVNIVSSDVASGGTASADDADFTAGTTLGTPAMGVFDSSPDTVTDGDLGTIGINANRAVRTVIEAGTANIGDVDIASIAAGDNNIGNVDVASSALPTGASTLAEQQSQTTHLATIAGDTTDIEAAVELIDDTVATLGTGTYTEASSKGIVMSAVRRDADTTLVDTTNEFSPLQVDANGRLKVEAFSGETLPVSLTSTTVTAISAGDNNIGNVDIVTLPGDVEADIDQIRDQIDLITPDIEEIRVDADAIRVATELIDDAIYVDDTATHATGTSKGMGMMAAAVPTDTSISANDIGMVAMTTDRKLHVAVMDALPAGTAAIGKLAANSGVDIGDVDVTSVTPGSATTNLGKAEDAGHTFGAGGVGVLGLGVRNDTPNFATVNTNADYAALTLSEGGGLRTALYEEDFAVLGTNHVKKYYTNAGAVTDGIVWSPAAGKRWYVTDIFINVSAAATVTLEDDKAGGDEVVWKAELAANSGWSHHFATPLFSGEDAADLLVTTSAGNVYITITGYEI